MMRQFELVERVKSYDPSTDEDALNRAYVYAMKAHGAQKRASGDPYFSHPIEVAGILTGYKLDAASIVTALAARHDRGHRRHPRRHRKAVRAGDRAPGRRRDQAVAHRTAVRSAPSRRRISASWSSRCREDIRVLLVKLADRLHNMRTLQLHQGSGKAPAHRARDDGDLRAARPSASACARSKDELEDLAFAELNPDARDSIMARLNFLREQGGGLIEPDHGRTAAHLDARPASTRRCRAARRCPIRSGARCSARTSPSSSCPTSWPSASSSRMSGECYHALGVIHGRYPMVPGRFKDYISTPKPNGYRSLHTGVIGPERQRIEIQIRTREMHEVAELGVAAHWVYKQGARPDRRDAIPLAARAARYAGACLEPRGVPRAHQARDVPGPGVLLHAQGRSDRTAARRRRRSISPMPCTRRSAIPASAPRSTAASCRCARRSTTATRSRSSPRRRRRRRRPGNASSSPARRARASAASSAPSSASNISISARRSCRRRFRQEGHELTEKALEERAQDLQGGQRPRI